MATVGALVGDPTRAEIRATLLDGRAHTVGELARHAGVAVSTASEHLGRLLDGGLVAVEAQGRHRYHRLAGPEVAALIESIQGLAVASSPVAVTAPAALTFARSCYDHLAGTVAVAVYDGLVADGWLGVDDARPVLTPAGDRRFGALGIDVAVLARRPRPVVRSCLDWTERRHHLAGALGAALLGVLVDRRWVVRRPSSRGLDVTDAGLVALADEFGVDLLRRRGAATRR